MPGKLFQVWVPAPLVQRYGAQVISQRFEDHDAGKTWQAGEKKRLADEALAAKKGREVDRILGPVQKDISLTAAKGHWMSESAARKSTLDYYELLWTAHLEKDLGELKVAQITRSRVRHHLDAMRDAGKSQETRRRVLMVLRAILDDARGRGYTVDHGVWKLEIKRAPRKRARVYDPDLVEQLIAAASGQDRTMLQVAAWTGMRLAELIAFEPSWIRWSQRRIEVPATDTKNAKDRSIPLFAELEALLRAHLGDRQAGRVFRPHGHGSAGKAWTKDGMISAFDRLAKAAGVPFSGWHDLRHHYASDLAHRGASAAELMQVLGWSDLATAQKYIHASPKHLAGLRSRLETSTKSSTANPWKIQKRVFRLPVKPASNQ